MQEPFVDYYELMQISPGAEPETIHRVYRMLAMRLHPDNPSTGDLEAFLALNEAYAVLSDSVQRAAYDAAHCLYQTRPLEVFDTREFALGLESEANRRLGVLCLLYSHRRADSEGPGVSLLQLESLMGIPREHLLFSAWYLREKEFVRFDESSSLLITAAGVDFVEQNLLSGGLARKLLKGRRSSVPAEPATSSLAGDGE